VQKSQGSENVAKQQKEKTRRKKSMKKTKEADRSEPVLTNQSGLGRRGDGRRRNRKN